MHISVSCVLNLVCTFHSAMDGCGRLWDLRSGKCLLLMDGHQSGVLGIDFSPNGYVCNLCPVAMPMVMCVCLLLCVCICVCVCVCVCVSVCIYVSVSVHGWMCPCVHMCVPITNKQSCVQATLYTSCHHFSLEYTWLPGVMIT